MNFAYSRVSTSNQSTKAQIEAINKSGYQIDEFFEEKISGKNKDRPRLQQMLSKLRKGDSVIVSKLDRLARSLKDLLEISNEIDEKRADLIILDQNIDTSKPTGRLVFSILGALAEFERSLIIERTSAGRKIAKENGVKFGRKSKTSDRDLALIKVLHQEGKSYNEIAKEVGISRISVYRKLINMGLVERQMNAS